MYSLCYTGFFYSASYTGNSSILFLFVTEVCSIIWKDHILCCLPFIGGHLGCFLFGVACNRATRNHLIQIFMRMFVFILYCVLFLHQNLGSLWNSFLCVV